MTHVEDRGRDSGRLRWRVRWREPDGRQRSRSFIRRDEAERYAREVATRLDRGDYIDPTEGRTPLADIARLWIARKYEAERKASTIIDYESLLRVHVLPALGRYPVASIRYQDVSDFSIALRSSGLSASRRKRALEVIAQILDEAIRRSMITTNVARLLEMPSIPKRPRHRYLTHLELADLADAGGEYRPLILLFGYTGLRWSEAVALRPMDIDIERRRIHVHRAQSEATGSITYDAPKTGKARTVPMIDLVAEVIEPLIRPDPESLLFTAPRGGPVRHSNFSGSRWYPAVDATVGRPLRIHDLRHTAASLARASGADLFLVARMLGHADPSITAQVYADLFDDELDVLQARLSRASRDAVGTRETGTDRDGEGRDVSISAGQRHLRVVEQER